MISPLPRRFLALAGLLLAPAVTALHAEMQTLTDTQGRTLHADVISVNGDQVTIKRDDGQTFTLPLSELSASDQTSLKDWASKHLPAGSVTLSYGRDQVHSDSKPTANAKTTSKTPAQQWDYNVTVFNHTVNPLANVRVDYAIFQSHVGAKSDKAPAPQVGTKSIDSIAMRSQASFTTDSVTLSMSTATKTLPAAPTSAVRGIWLRVYVGDQLVAEACSPDDLSKTETWPGNGPTKPAKKSGKKGT